MLLRWRILFGRSRGWVAMAVVPASSSLTPTSSILIGMGGLSIT